MSAEQDKWCEQNRRKWYPKYAAIRYIEREKERLEQALDKAKEYFHVYRATELVEECKLHGYSMHRMKNNGDRHPGDHVLQTTRYGVQWFAVWCPGSEECIICADQTARCMESYVYDIEADKEPEFHSAFPDIKHDKSKPALQLSQEYYDAYSLLAVRKANDPWNRNRVRNVSKRTNKHSLFILSNGNVGNQKAAHRGD